MDLHDVLWSAVCGLATSDEGRHAEAVVYRCADCDARLRVISVRSVALALEVRVAHCDVCADRERA